MLWRLHRAAAGSSRPSASCKMWMIGWSANCFFGNDIRLPGARQPNSEWSYDFVHDQLVDGRALKMLSALDEYTRACLAIEAGVSLRSQDVILTLSRLMRLHGKLRSYGRTTTPNLAAQVMRWLLDAAIGRAFIAPGSPRVRRKLHRQTARRNVESRMVPKPGCPSNAGGSSTTSAGSAAHIALNLRSWPFEPGCIPIISTRDPLPDWPQNSAVGQGRSLRFSAVVMLEVTRDRALEIVDIPVQIAVLHGERT